MNSNTMHRFLSVYSIVNIIYLFGLLIISLIHRQYPELLFPSFLAFIPISLIIYLLVMLPYFHIVYYIILSFLCVRKYIQEKTR